MTEVLDVFRPSVDLPETTDEFSFPAVREPFDPGLSVADFPLDIDKYHAPKNHKTDMLEISSILVHTAKGRGLVSHKPGIFFQKSALH